MEAVYEMVEVFIQNSTSQLYSLKSNLQNKEWDQIKETAHKLIPGFGHLGNQVMVDLLVDLENYLHHERNRDEHFIESMIHTIVTKGFDQIDVLENERSKLIT